MMKLYEILFTSGEHEMERMVYASATGSHYDATKYLIDSGIVDEDLPLTIESVNEFTTAYASNGDPYKVELL